MSKKTSRILALGLLMSSMVVMGLDVWSKEQFNSAQSTSPDALVENVAELENKIEDLESENVRLSDEVNRLSQGYANTLTISDVVENANEDEDGETVTTSNQQDEDEEDDSEKYTVTVRDGEPSSVVAEQLESLGVIEDRYDFNDYLEKNDLAKKVRPGNYVVSTGMNNEELAQAIIR